MVIIQFKTFAKTRLLGGWPRDVIQFLAINQARCHSLKMSHGLVLDKSCLRYKKRPMKPHKGMIPRGDCPPTTIPKHLKSRFPYASALPGLGNSAGSVNEPIQYRQYLLPRSINIVVRNVPLARMLSRNNVHLVVGAGQLDVKRKTLLGRDTHQQLYKFGINSLNRQVMLVREFIE
jgi:hypothetical protein